MSHREIEVHLQRILACPSLSPAALRIFSTVQLSTKTAIHIPVKPCVVEVSFTLSPHYTQKHPITFPGMNIPIKIIFEALAESLGVTPQELQLSGSESRYVRLSSSRARLRYSLLMCIILL